MKNNKLLIVCICSALIGGVLIDATDLVGIPIVCIATATVSGILCVTKFIVRVIEEI